MEREEKKDEKHGEVITFNLIRTDCLKPGSCYLQLPAKTVGAYFGGKLFVFFVQTHDGTLIEDELCCGSRQGNCLS